MLQSDYLRVLENTLFDQSSFDFWHGCFALDLIGFALFGYGSSSLSNAHQVTHEGHA